MDHYLPDNDKFKQPGWNPTSTDSMFATIVHDLKEKGMQLDRIEKNMEAVKIQNADHATRLGSLEDDRKNIIEAGKGAGKVAVWTIAGFFSAAGTVGGIFLEKYITKWF